MTWALDNGAFSKFDAANFLRLMDRDEAHRAMCKFVCAPDVVGSARRTLELFDAWEPKITQRRWPVALVAQDGIEDRPIPWERLDAVFIGGTTRWKTSDAAMQTAVAAKTWGKWLHVGRVNTSERFDRWEEVADSMDGTGVSRYSHMRRSMAAPLLWTPSGGCHEVYGPVHDLVSRGCPPGVAGAGQPSGEGGSMSEPSEEDRERAREIAGVCENSAVVPNCFGSQRQCDRCLNTRLIASALAAARAEERERAAGIADDKAAIGIMRSMEATYKADMAREIAAAIRGQK